MSSTRLDNGIHASDRGANPGASARPAPAPSADEAAADPFAALQASAREVQAAVGDYVQARVDGVRAVIRNALLKIVLLIAAVLVAVVTVTIGLALLLIGAANGLGSALGIPLWAGYLVVGAVAVALPLLLSRIQMQGLRHRWLEKARAKYAAREARRSA